MGIFVCLPRLMACQDATIINIIESIPCNNRQLTYFIGNLFRKTEVIPIINISNHAIIPRMTPVLLNVVMSVVNASIGSTPDSKYRGNTIKNGCKSRNPRNIYPKILWNLITFHLRARFSLFRFPRDRKNCPISIEKEMSVNTDMISFKIVRRGISPTAQKSRGKPINTLTNKNILLRFILLVFNPMKRLQESTCQE